ncbi:MAG: YceG family protein [Lachnospiraceae bacterium]
MFEHKTLQKLEEYFTQLSDRSSQGIYFYRITGYNDSIGQFISKYYEAARVSGAVIEGRIQNPDEKNLSYYEEIMGMEFQMSMGFFTASLKKWLPRMNEMQRNQVAGAIYDTLNDMMKEGKNEAILRNAYIKFMCWLYYKFERILNQLGNEKIPKILYEGTISNYELKLLTILSNAGCDIVLLQYHGDKEYLKLDKESKWSYQYQEHNLQEFPPEFNIQWLREGLEREKKVEQLYGRQPQILNCTNTWITGGILENILKDNQARGNDPKLYYNCFCRINGVEDKLTYINELYQFQLQMKNSKRHLVVAEHEIPQPTPDEIATIVRSNYLNPEQMLLELSKNIQYTANVELQRMMVKSFVDIMLEEGKRTDITIHKLTNLAVYLLCWLKRYQSQLFSNWKMPELSCFIYLGGCKNQAQAMFLKMLSKLPIDVLLLKPDLNIVCVLEDTSLYEKNNQNSMVVDKFPRENAEIQMGTAAYHAERELDTLMYQDSGMYRNRQYNKAISVSLRTMYEEIAILWNQEVKYRPNFSVVDSVVNVPVIFAKISGVKDGLISPYWQGIRNLVTEDTFLITKTPFLNATDENPMKPYVAEFYKNGKLQKEKIKNHPSYPYGYLREEIQDYILEKLQLLIQQKMIRGTGENGTEYTIISVVLNLNKEIIRKIQNFDFTQKNPKIIYINTTEKIISLEDSIMIGFLNLVGFDITFFIPTGYQNVEKFFNEKGMEEHQIGDYLYDLQLPNLERRSSNVHHSWREKIFKRGN